MVSIKALFRSLSHALLAIFILFLIPLTFGNFEPNAQFFALICLVLGGVIWLILILRIRDHIPIPKLAVPFLFYITLQALLLVKSPVPAYGTHAATYGIYLFVMFIFITRVTVVNDIRKIWKMVLISLGIVFSALYAFLFINWYLRWTALTGNIFNLPPSIIRPPGLFLHHPNGLAGYLNLIIPLVVIRTIESKRVTRITWSCAILLMLGALFFTSSRSAWLALAVSFSAMITLGLIGTSSYKEQIDPTILKKFYSTKTLIIGSISLVLIGLVVFALNAQIQRTAHGTFSYRLAIWDHAIHLIKSSPIIGYGPNSTPFLYALRREGIGGDEVYHAHNLFLQTTLETGFIGLLILALGMYIVLSSIIAAWKASKGKYHLRNELIAYVGVVIGVVVHHMLDFTFGADIYAVGVLYSIASIYNMSSRDKFIIVPNKIVASIIAIIVIVIAGGTTYSTKDLPFYWESMLNVKSGELIKSRNDICNIALNDPGKSVYNFNCALLNSYIYFETDDLRGISDAYQFQVEGITIDPYFYLNWANLATYEWQLGKRNAALQHMRKAVDMAPNTPFLWLNAGWMAEELGYFAEANNFYEIATCLNPSFYKAPYFDQIASRRDRGKISCPKEYDTLRNDPYTNYIYSGEQLFEAGMLDAAIKTFEEAISYNPRIGLAYVLLGNAQVEKGLLQEADYNIQTGLFIDPVHPYAFLVAANVYKKIGEDEQAIEYINKSFDLMDTTSFTNGFYASAYRIPPQSVEVSPFIKTIILPEFIVAFTNYAQELVITGQNIKAQKILKWLGDARRRSP